LGAARGPPRLVGFMFSKRTRILLALVAAGALVASVVARGAMSSRAGAGGGADQALQRALQRIVEMRGGPPGVLAMVQRGHHRSLLRAGTGNLRSGLPIRARDHMRVASISKAFNGAVALALVERGKLSLADKIGRSLPGLPQAWRRITLSELLHHTSGLPDYSADRRFQMMLVAHPHKRWRPRQLLRFVVDKPLTFAPPGSSYHYSNTDNLVVGLMVHAATNSSYKHQLRARVLRRLGLGETSLPDGFDLPRPLVHGYDIDPPHPPEDITRLFSMSSAWASGGIQSTPVDLNRFIRAYAGGRLFGRGVRRRQLRFVTGGSDPPGPGKNAAGLAIFRYRTRCGTVYGHTGSFPGYTQFAAATATGRRSVTVSVNAQLGPNLGQPGTFAALRRAYELAACAALRG
jgi:D-alanyl-D-alanine carboxypeptidase